MTEIKFLPFAGDYLYISSDTDIQGACHVSKLITELKFSSFVGCRQYTLVQNFSRNNVSDLFRVLPKQEALNVTQKCPSVSESLA